MFLYAQYIKERENRHIIEKDFGFITYSFQEDMIFIDDIFISQAFRHSGLAKELGLEIERIAKEKDIKKLGCSIIPSTNGSNYALQNFLSWGFKLNSSTNNFILLIKDLSKE